MTSFLQQYGDLFSHMPKLALYNDNTLGSENCEYTNDLTYSKNCYLVFNSRYNENCSYAYVADGSKNSSDLSICNYDDQCYECIDCHHSYQCSFLIDSTDCQNCTFSHSLHNCQDCILCSGLSNTQYCIFNKQYTKEEYNRMLPDYIIDGRNDCLSRMKEKFVGLLHESKRETMSLPQCEHSVGSYLLATKSCIGADSDESEDCKYIMCTTNCKDSNDIIYTGYNQLCYEGIAPDHSYQALCCLYCLHSKHIYYSSYCNDCSHCFGCVGLRSKSYCILNKQYTKEEYAIQVAKIINHMRSGASSGGHEGSGGQSERGEFFHPSLSPFGYNETVAQEYFPLTKSEALARGYKRSDYNPDPVIPTGVETLQGDQIPNDISLVGDDILTKILICEVSKRPFKIQKSELEFYRTHHLPLPRKHPDIRHEERMRLRPGRTMFLRTCDKCDKEILSVYDRDYSGKVYCEKCYQKEVYS